MKRSLAFWGIALGLGLAAACAGCATDVPYGDAHYSRVYESYGYGYGYPGYVAYPVYGYAGRGRVVYHHDYHDRDHWRGHDWHDRNHGAGHGGWHGHDSHWHGPPPGAHFHPAYHHGSAPRPGWHDASRGHGFGHHWHGHAGYHGHSGGPSGHGASPRAR